MLERASTCLESGGRQLFRTPTPCLCLRSRQTPYASFLHHAAASAALAVPATSDRASGDVDDGAAASPAPATTLDFLYPEKTLELLRRLSVASPHANVRASVSRRPQPLPLARIRHYSTAAAQPKPRPDGPAEDDAAVAAAAAAKLKEEKRREFQDHVRWTTPQAALKKLLRQGESGKQDLAWRLWDAMIEDTKKSKSTTSQNYVNLRHEFLTYAVADGAAVNPKRVMQVFLGIPEGLRRPSSYRAVILTYLAHDDFKFAAKFHDEAQMHTVTQDYDFGTNALLLDAFTKKRWDLGLRVFESFLRQKAKFHGDETVARIQQGDCLLQVWGQVAQLPELLEDLFSLVDYFRRPKTKLLLSKEGNEGLDLFVQSLVPNVVPRILNVPKPDEDAIWDYMTKLFDNLQALGLSLSPCYEYTIKEMLKLRRYQVYTNSSRKIWLLLYRKYRKQFINVRKSKLHSNPSLDLIRRLITQQGLHGNLSRVRQLVDDIRIFHPGQPISSEILVELIHLFSKYGETAQAHEYFEEFRLNYGDQVGLKLLSALVYAHARLIDVDGATQQFKRIQQDYGLTPDRRCWNTLLLAHVRAEDLDGALECFNDSLDAGVKPDVYTFGPMLDMCANRGDIEAFEALYSRAKQMYIPLDTDVRARSAYVQVFLSADDPEGAEAIAQGMLKSRKAGVLRDLPFTHTWNIMIQYYALKGDVTSSRRLYREMLQNKIPLDSMTYSSLMRSLIEIKQTNAAYKILRVTMPAKNLRVLAIHYAIVMTGFLREGQYKLAEKAYKRMVGRNVVPTESSRLASIQTVGRIEVQKLEWRKYMNPGHRLKRVENLIREMLLSPSGQEVAHEQPRTGQYFDLPVNTSIPATYYGLLISLYNTRKSYEICQELILKARQSQPNQGRGLEPISFLTAIMDVHLKTGEHEEVEKCWTLALHQARRLTKTFYDAMHAESGSDIDASSSVAPNRRQILVHTTRIYIRSLIKRKALQEAKRTVEALLADGFAVNNSTWNQLVQGLANGGRVTDAFAICEKYLMPRFPGWRVLNPRYIRNELPGYTWMDLRHYDLERSSKLPRYKTMVVLSKTYAMVRQQERNGFGYNEATTTWLRESLDNVAPMTVRAIETMPRTNDDFQEKYLDI